MTAVFQGRAEDRRESLGSLARGFGFALFVIYALLVILFNSYFQPVIVMVSIPFGIVGAVLGHLLFGYDLSIVSMMGIVALSGIVVNDSLILIDFINRKRRSLEDPIEAVAVSACARFRAIILTSLTTFLGLSPMILETSMQARFLIPMALSLGFGVLFATGITLVLVPCLYCVLRDVKRGFGGALAPARPGADPSRGR
jgi:multidrug efflux pump subunit AcrB